MGEFSEGCTAVEYPELILQRLRTCSLLCSLMTILAVHAGASRTHFDWGCVSIELPEYVIFIKLPEFYFVTLRSIAFQ